MRTARAIRVWHHIHKWTSLVCTAFLLLLCVTGLPLIFKDEIERLLESNASPTATTSTAASLDRVIEAALRRYPGHVPHSLYWDEHYPNIIRLSLASKPNVDWKDVRWISIDARSGQVMDDALSDPLVTEVILKLHKELLAGVPGELFLGAMGLVFIASIISGVAVYGPFMRRIESCSAAVARNKQRRKVLISD